MHSDRTCILAPGPNGAIPTVRFEVLRESVQACQARLYIDLTLQDPARRAALGEELASRCQGLLDERLRSYLRIIQSGPRLDGGRQEIWFDGSGWADRDARLYELAGEVARKLGAH